MVMCARWTFRRFLAVVGPAVLLLTLLSGCMDVERGLRLNGDGSGSYTLTLGFREPTSGDPDSVSEKVVTPLNAFADHVQATGGSTTRHEDQGYAYWTFTRPFMSVAEANTLLQEDPRQYDPNHSPVLYHDSLHIARETRLLSTVYHVSGTISLVDLLNNAQSWSDATERLTITLPEGIISATGGARQGESVTYTIHYNESAQIDVVGKVSDSQNTLGLAPLFVGGICGVLALALLVVGIRLLRRPAAT
jgi:hypothetical protein